MSDFFGKGIPIRGGIRSRPGPISCNSVNRDRLRKMSLILAQNGLSFVFRDLKLRPFRHVQFIDDQDDFYGRVRPFAQSIERLKGDNCAWPAIVPECEFLLCEVSHRRPGLVLHLNIKPDGSLRRIVHRSGLIFIQARHLQLRLLCGRESRYVQEEQCTDEKSRGQRNSPGLYAGSIPLD